MVRWAAGLVLGLWSVLLIAWLTLHWGILPRLDEWRPQIEQRVGQALGAPLSIGAVRVRSGSWIPAFELDDVRVLDGQGRVALELGRVSAALSPASLLALAPRFAQLHLDGVRLDVRRDAAGRISVAGLDMAAGEPIDPAALDWFFEQHEFVIRRGTLRWTDEMRSAPPLTLSGVDLVLRNGRRRHELRLDATPPPDWGRPFALRGSFVQPLTARAFDWQRWRGTLYADLPQVDVSQLSRYLTLPFQIEQGRGALRGWFEIDNGRPVEATADLALAAVALQLGPDLPPLALAQLRGRLSAQRQPGSLALAVESLGFVTDDGVPWAPSTLRLALTRGANVSADAPWTGGRFSADRLALAPLARLAARLPLPVAVHQGLADLAPEGELQNLAVEWTGSVDAPSRYKAQARATGLALAAGPPGPPAYGMSQTPGRPGVSGANLEFSATERGGEAKLSLQDGAVFLPGVFEQAELPLNALTSQMAWRIEPATAQAPPAVVLTVRELNLANADLRAHLSGSWRTGPGTGFGTGQRYPGVIDLKGRILSGDSARVVRYLPLGVPVEARQYVGRAVGPGRITSGDVAVQGDLWRFPFIDGSPGTFRIRLQARDLRYAFLPSEPGWNSPWPAMTAVNGELEFDRVAMRIRDARAVIDGVALRGVNGGIADLVHNPVLQLEGQGRGAAVDLLRFVNGTPVGEWTGGALRQATIGGAAELTLALSIPLATPDRSVVRGSVLLPGNDLRIQTGTPLLAQARGRVDFSQRGFTIVGGRARALGGETAIEGGTQPDGSLRFTAQGQATGEGLLRVADLPMLAPLTALGESREPRLRGQTAYRAQLAVVQGRPELLVTSTLAGLALDMPAPLAKPAAASWPLRLQTAGLPGRVAADLLALDLGEVLHARYERDLSGEDARVLRGALGVGTEAPPLPETGVAAAVRLQRLDLDAWRHLAPQARQVNVAGAAGNTFNPGGPGAAGAAPASGGVSALMPSQISLRTGELAAGGRRLSNVTLDLRRQPALAETVWRAQVKAEQGEGWVEWRQPREAAAPGRLSAHLARLDVPASDAGAVEEWLEQAPASVPALQLAVDEFHWRGKALGKLEIAAENRAGRPGVREWQLDRLKLSTVDATLLARGVWSAGQRTSLAFDLDIADGGRFFERMGAGKAIQGGKGRIEGELSWPGSPLSPDPGELRGRFAVALGEGRFLNAEPGVARLFGVLSLQALPRRLLLDFRDVFQQGLAFDTITGDVALDAGVARTANLRVLGVQAAVLIEGSANLKSETQDLRIVAVPELNTTTASLAWAALNPAIGLGAFVAQLLLRQPMTAAATREFHVTGPWGEPKVERVDRGAAVAASAAASAAAAAASNPAGRTP
jgi:uncharacterized protein (TIGR02099 family)